MIEAPTTQERYTQAIQSSSLRVEADVRGDADYLIAAGWCKSRFGAVLIRLQAEWDASERLVPQRPTKRDIMKAALVNIETRKEKKEGKERLKHVRKITSESMEEARERLMGAYTSERKRALAPLKSLPAAGLHLSLKMALDGEMLEDLPAQVLLYWLSPNCRVCHGTGVQAATEKGCGKCRERPGFEPIPGGLLGKMALDYIEDCVARARADMRTYFAT
ncbi:MAG: hypothetical protein ITG01_11925 [Comamonas sp.]|nr:hypothetical protein [Comamonas sp.]